MKLSYTFILLLALSSLYSFTKDDDKVTSIPNVGEFQTDYNFAVYSGYLALPNTQK